VNNAALTEATPARTTLVNKTMTPRVQDDVPERIQPLAAATGTREPFGDARVMFRRA
jgi:hypothetical protein